MTHLTTKVQINEIDPNQYQWCLNLSNYGEVSFFKTDDAYFEALDSARSKYGSGDDNVSGFHASNKDIGGLSFQDILDSEAESPVTTEFYVEV